MVTVPVLTVDSGLKGSNLPPSGLSESSGFLSGEFCAPGDATDDADAAINSAAAAHVKNLNRLMIFLARIPTIDFRFPPLIHEVPAAVKLRPYPAWPSETSTSLRRRSSGSPR